MNRTRGLIILVVIVVLYRYIPTWLYITLLLVGCALLFAYSMVQRNRFVRINKRCPQCGKDMRVQRRSHKIDQKGFVRVGGKWVKGDHVIEYKKVLYCQDCQYELDV